MSSHVQGLSVQHAESQTPPCARQVLEDARRFAVAPADARLLLQHVLCVSHAQLIARPERALGPGMAERFRSLIVRRAAGEPLAYLTGHREFFGLDVVVSPDVLIPRPETEMLVDLASSALRTLPAPRVLDAGTGSGAIALALARSLPNARVVALDRSTAALAVASENARRHGVDIEFVCSDWFAALDGQVFDAIVANPPYIAAGDPHLAGEIRYEPQMALRSGADGLDALRCIVAGAPRHLKAGAALWVEHGYDQAPAVSRLFRAAGFSAIETWPDLAGVPRVTGGIFE